ncbi:H-type lectin domain-containing protein [Catenovulum sp. 2E275]|uniref:H-type lectin domain-containing protein n=1 Tax=Catenovulum sp. 2E275 TaxID=2980497 RepID=UPI0021CF08A2|nr:H-type lectin domain-containing protein [Catenovulum sp. 2E275]MCU4675542.1 H-type lectin domain-containing protein [Catenovulum sp. 2E275]
MWLIVGSKLVAQAVNEQMKTYDDALFVRLSDLAKTLEGEQRKATFELNKIQQGAQDLETLRKLATSRLTGVSVETGKLQINQQLVDGLNSAEECKKRGTFEHFIPFNHVFSTVPVVLPSFSLIDFGHGQDHRLKVNVIEVSTEGFKLDFNTWCDTRMSQAEVSWLAIGV